MAAGKQVSGSEKGGFSESPPSIDAFAARDHTREGKEGEWVERALRLTCIVVIRSSTGGSGSLRVLHADDGNGGWYGFTGAGNTRSARNLDVGKVLGLLIREIRVSRSL